MVNIITMLGKDIKTFQKDREIGLIDLKEADLNTEWDLIVGSHISENDLKFIRETYGEEVIIRSQTM